MNKLGQQSKNPVLQNSSLAKCPTQKPTKILQNQCPKEHTLGNRVRNPCRRTPTQQQKKKTKKKNKKNNPIKNQAKHLNRRFFKETIPDG